MVKFDFAGVLVSRDVGLQPSPSRPVLVYIFFVGIVISQDIHFLGSLPPNDGVSLYKTYIGCILHILGYIDAKFDREYSLIRVDIMVQPSEHGPIAVYFYVPEKGSRMASDGSLINLFVWEIRWLNYLPVSQLQYIPIHKASSPEASTFSQPLIVTTESPYTNLILDIFVIHLNILKQKMIVVVSILEKKLGIKSIKYI